MRINPPLFTCTAILASAVLSTAPASADPVFFGPTPYRSASDAPFSGSGYSYSYLETFEDGLNTPGVQASGGFVIGGDPFVDSVDSDDGVLDGVGGSGSHSWYSNGLHALTFTFDALTLGALPTEVGIVWTDIGYNAPTSYFGPVTFEAFGANGASLGILTSLLMGDGMDTGQTGEDRFFGVSDSQGISAIRMATNNGDWEVDHLQYKAQPVPEPSTLALLALGAVGLMRGRRARP